jgi:hypothetical protein
MKRIFILTLVCTTALNACYTKEDVEQAGFHKNWNPSNKERLIQQGNKTFTIDKHHVPTYENLPIYTKVCFPIPAKNYLDNVYDIHFVTNGMLEEGVVLGPETGSLRYGWTRVRNRQDIVKTVPTAELWISTFEEIEESLTKDELLFSGYKQNWKERKNMLKNTVKNTVLVGINTGSVEVDKKNIPARTHLPLGIEVYFPVSCINGINKINDMNEIFNYGHYRGAATPTNNQPFLSIIEDSNGNEYSVPTALLMIDSSLVDGMMSPTPPSTPTSPQTK